MRLFPPKWNLTVRNQGRLHGRNDIYREHEDLCKSFTWCNEVVGRGEQVETEVGRQEMAGNNWITRSCHVLEDTARMKIGGTRAGPQTPLKSLDFILEVAINPHTFWAMLYQEKCSEGNEETVDWGQYWAQFTGNGSQPGIQAECKQDAMKIWIKAKVRSVEWHLGSWSYWMWLPLGEVFINKWWIWQESCGFQPLCHRGC